MPGESRVFDVSSDTYMEMYKKSRRRKRIDCIVLIACKRIGIAGIIGILTILKLKS
jgi:hypothetical protein